MADTFDAASVREFVASIGGASEVRAARRTLRAHGERKLLAEHETNVGNLYYHLDRHKAALECYDRAHAIFAELGDPTHLAYLDHNRAAVLYELDRLDEARGLYARS